MLPKIDLLLDDGHTESEKFDKDTVKLITELCSYDNVFNLCSDPNSKDKHNLAKYWKEILSVNSVINNRLQPKLRLLQKSFQYDKIKASDLLMYEPSRAVQYLFGILNSSMMPRIYEDKDSFSVNIKDIIQHQNVVNIIDVHIFEITKAIEVYLQKGDLTRKEIKELCSVRIAQIRNLISTIIENNDNIRLIRIISQFTRKYRFTNLELVSGKTENQLLDAKKQICRMMFKIIEEDIDLEGKRIELKDISNSVDKNLLLSPHDRMIYTTDNTNWCATAGFALNTKNDDPNFIKPQGYFVKIMDSSTLSINDFSHQITELTY